MRVLIGNTGLIGQTLLDNMSFTHQFNSSNIDKIQSFKLDNAEIYLACLPATKWKVNQDVLKDFENLSYIISLLKSFRYSKIVLFSTIDVYSDSALGSNEDHTPVISRLNYGANRLIFEHLVSELKTEVLQIFRLPALFGPRIKKNIIFDLLNDNNVEAINSESIYQWYNLKDLNTDILTERTGIINLFTEPIRTNDILKLFDVTASNGNAGVVYDFTTKYSYSGYTKSAKTILNDIEEFIDEYRNKPSSVS